MKKILFGFIILSAISFSCAKKDTSCNYSDSNVTAPASEVANVQAYLTTNSITATQHSSGFFYKINQVGTGQAVVNLCSMVTVKYAGRLTNGTYFDQQLRVQYLQQPLPYGKLLLAGKKECL